ncbi:MAG: hypothetical protein ACI93R_001468 [Flavobacteriales bacterium]|jgi:hypothetical protein
MKLPFTKLRLYHLALVVFISLFSVSLHALVKLYRYVDNNGVQVINSAIPTEYVQKGYDVITAKGELLKRVPPAPSSEQISQVNREREILAAYKSLKRRFNTIEEIERAKERKLASINTNISILKGSISNLNINIANLVKRAAASERSGRKVSKTLLKQMEDTKTELYVSEGLLKLREQEYIDVSAGYDTNIREFVLGESLVLKKKKGP